MESYLKELREAIAEIDKESIDHITGIILNGQKNNKTVYIFGNGDSATNAFHFAADLSKTAIMHKKRLKIICLNENIPLMTAWANDDSYESIYAKQLENLLEKWDVVIGISTSGNSPNVLRALEFANEKEAITIALTASEGGKARGVARHCFSAKTKNVEIAEDVHFIIGHMVKYQLIKKWAEEGHK